LLVASDFDGTLAEIVPEPDSARALPAAVTALRELRGLVGTVALISGRSTADLQRLVDVQGVRVLGDYGQPSDRRPDPALERFRAAAEAAVAGIPGARVEAKPGAVAIHFRSRPELGQHVLSAVTPAAAQAGLDVRRGRMVIEVLPRDWDKSRALADLVTSTSAAGAVFLGDDYGDRGCFQYLAGLDRPHLAVGVASEETPAEVFAACDLVVEGPSGAAEFLSRLAAAARARGPAGP
jgi:trehalose 6-phosphate phosphatase